MKRTLIILSLLILNIASAIGVVESTQITREMFYRLQVQRVKRDRLATEWAQLRLEESAWASPDRVAQVASKDFNMIEPKDYIVLGGH